MAQSPTPAPSDAPADGVQHSRGCPAKRIESYPATTPTRAVVTVVRCQDCGASVVNQEKNDG